jgi:hypothetical protein
MLGIPVRYLLTHPLAALNLAADPLQAWTTLVDLYVNQREQRRTQCQYESDSDWEQQLHQQLGVEWPCKLTSEF